MESDPNANREETTESTQSAKHAVLTVPRNRPITEASFRSNEDYASFSDDQMSRLMDSLKHTISNDYQVFTHTATGLIQFLISLNRSWWTRYAAEGTKHLNNAC
jgi:hypothetical protein